MSPIKQTVADNGGSIGTCLSGVTFLNCFSQLVDNYATIMNLTIAILTVVATITFYIFDYLLRSREARRKEIELQELRRRNDLMERTTNFCIRRRNNVKR